MSTGFVESLAAETHPAAYMLHKYWSRKPHNVLAAIFAEFPNRGVFVDPFCGSGVALSEAATLGFNCVGADVNPIARLLTQVTVAPPDERQFERRVLAVLDAAERQFGERFSVRGEPNALRFALHAVVVRCAGCGREVASTEAGKDGRRYVCPSCGQRLNINLENLCSTRITEVATHGSHTSDPATCAEQLALSGPVLSDGRSEFDRAFAVNRRTLAFQGLTTRALFTARNFACLTFLAQQFHAFDEPGLRDAALVLLTSTVAQCSRLIASRNGLTTGGQAWTVPGFWVPPIHLETNPLSHLRTRITKFSRGLSQLRQMPRREASGWTASGSAAGVLETMRVAGTKADVVFLDPPYGDSVPYVEFSSLWNSFLGDMPDPDLDIAVTDRLGKHDSWRRYETALSAIVAAIPDVLAAGGGVVVTFNNKDPRAWRALLASTQRAGLLAEHVAYQHPAVVSAKAQLAPEGSYVGDFYCILRRSERESSRDLSPVVDALRRAAAAHGGAMPESLIQRVAITAFLRCNISADLVDEVGLMTQRLFPTARDGRRVWRGELPQDTESIGDAIARVVRARVSRSKVSLKQAYAIVVGELGHLGVPEPAVVEAMLDRDFLLDDGWIVAIGNAPTNVEQLQLRF